MDLSSVYIPACIRTQSFSSNGIEYDLNFIVVVIHSFLLAPCHIYARVYVAQAVYTVGYASTVVK